MFCDLGKKYNLINYGMICSKAWTVTILVQKEMFFTLYE